MELRMKRGVFAVAFSLFLLGMSAASARAEWGSYSCSDATLKGDYGFTITGQILTGPAPGPVTGVAMTHFDGAGNLTQEDFAVHNGSSGSGFVTGESGTYTVNSDCTGSATINFPDGRPPISLMFVVTKRGSEIRTVVANSGDNITSIGTRTDWPF